MPIRNPDADRFDSFENGVDTTSNSYSTATRGTLSVANNADLVDDSLVVKRKGVTPLGSAWGTHRIRQLFSYKNTDGSEGVFVYGEDASPTGLSGTLGLLSSTSTPTTIQTGLKDGVKPTFIQFEDFVYLFTGNENLIVSSTGTRQIGLDFPTVVPTFNAFTSGSLNTKGSYLFVYTYFNSTTGAESSPSEASSAIVTTTDTALSGIIINVAAGNSALADKIRVYRTTAGGRIFFLDGETSISSTTYTSTVRDAGLGQQLETDNERLVDPVFSAITNDSRIFVLTENSRVRYSKIGQSGSMPESFQALDFIDCTQNKNDQASGLGKAGSTIIVIKQKSVGRLTQLTANLNGLELAGSQKYIYEEISNDITFTNPHCILSLDNLCVWLGEGEIFATDGLNIFRYGERIRNILNTLNYNQKWKFSAINRTDTKQLIWSVCRSGQNEPDYQIVAHYKKAPKIAFTFYTPGTNTTTHPGIQAASFTKTNLSGVVTYLLGSSANDGLVQKLGVGNSDNTKGIYFEIKLPWQSGNSEALTKLFHSCYLFVAGSGNNYNLNFALERNNIETAIVTASKSLLSNNSTNWNAANWNEFNWATVEFLPIKFFPHKKAYTGRYVFYNYNANEPIAIKAITTLVENDGSFR